MLLLFASVLSQSFLLQGKARIVDSTVGPLRLTGSGPPVLFQSALFGTVPAFFYTDLLKKLRQGVTLVQMEQRRPIDAKSLEGIADAIGAERIGLVAHSSIVPDLVQSPLLARCVLMDPITVQNPLAWFDADESSLELETDTPTLVAQTQPSENDGVSGHVSLDVKGAEKMSFADVGQSDVLDDLYAELGARFGLAGIETHKPPLASFDEWTRKTSKPTQNTTRKKRSEYRRHLADEVLRFLKQEGEVHDVISHAEVLT